MTSSEPKEALDKKYAIYFDIDDGALSIHYPYSSKEHSEKSYKSAYRMISKYLKSAGFTRQQGSGYISDKKINIAKMYAVIEEWANKMPWLADCFQRLDITVAGERHDVTEFFKFETAHLNEKETNTKGKSSTKDIDRIKAQRAINLDINQDLLKKNYPYKSKIHGPTTYKQAYQEIGAFMAQKGFKHRQYSGYLSRDAITMAKVRIVLKELGRTKPWLKECITNIDVTTAEKIHDVTELFKEKAALQNEKLHKSKSIGVHRNTNASRDVSR